MRNFREWLIAELFDADVKIMNVGRTGKRWGAEFIVDDSEYSFSAINRGDYWDVSFSIEAENDPYGLRGADLPKPGEKRGSAVKVFAAVRRCVEMFMKDVSPSVIQFSANAMEPSRVKLYERMAGQMAKAWNWKFEKDDPQNGHQVTYVLSHPDAERY